MEPQPPPLPLEEPSSVVHRFVRYQYYPYAASQLVLINGPRSLWGAGLAGWLELLLLQAL